MLFAGTLFLSPCTSTADATGFEGFGATTPGGNNGTVVEVTSLDDDGPGTLREALSKGDNHRIVFTVGGTIVLQQRLNIRGKKNITIDGATAPYPGITLQGNMLYIRTSHDIIVTHLRVRDSVADGILVWDKSSFVVIDHCSVTNSNDENISITEDTHDVTVSWSIMGDTRAVTDPPLRTKGMLIANTPPRWEPVTKVSLHHNLYHNEYQRSPQISTAGLFDVRNNVIRQWGSYGMRMRNGAWGNVINNVFASNTNPGDSVILAENAGPVYTHGNQAPVLADPEFIPVNDRGTASSLYDVAPVTTDPVAEVEQKVLLRVGALPRDAVDRAITGVAGPPATAPKPPQNLRVQ